MQLPAMKNEKSGPIIPQHRGNRLNIEPWCFGVDLNDGLELETGG
jgi:hypothetical protein